MTQQRTMEELDQRAQVARGRDPFDFEFHEYVVRLDWEHAQDFLQPDAEVTEEQWKARRPSLSPLAMVDEILHYMDFAWDKANGCRGISANRSIMHLIAWLWMAGEDELCRELERDLYENDAYCYYGKPQLVKVCRHYGVDWRGHDDDQWRNRESEPGLPADRALEHLGMEVLP